MPRYEAYKDSGVELLGDIPQDWKTKKLKYLGYMYAGLAGKKGDDFSKEPKSNFSRFIPFTSISTTAVVKQLYQYVLVKQHEEQNNVFFNDILFLMSSETLDDIGKCSIYKKNEENLYLNSFCKGFRTTSKFALPVYINYLLQSSYYRNYFGTVARGFTRINLKQEYVKGALIPLPNSEEQIAISNFLDQKTAQIDQAIAIKEKQITLLKERKQILIQNAVTRGLNPDAPMRDSGVEWIGEIPEHWSVLPNFSLFTERVKPGQDGLPLLSVSIHTGVSTEEINAEENIRGRVKIEDKTKYNLVKPHDIVFNMMRAWQGGIGAVSVEGMVSPAYIIAAPNNKINSQYFEHQYRSPIFIQQMDRFSKGITDFRKRLYWDEFKRLNTVVPPIDEQTAIVTHLNTETTKINKAIAIQQQQIKKLKEYKATLINSAVTGKIKVA